MRGGEIVDHLGETIAAGEMGAGTTVAIDMDEQEGMLLEPTANGTLLLIDGKLLITAARITQIGDAGGAGGKGRQIGRQDEEEAGLEDVTSNQEANDQLEDDNDHEKGELIIDAFELIFLE